MDAEPLDTKDRLHFKGLGCAFSPGLPPTALHPDLGRVVGAHKSFFSFTELGMTDSLQESSYGRLDGERGQLDGRRMLIKGASVGISHLFS